MKDLRTFFAKKKAKSGKEFVYKDTEIDIFEIEDKNGVKLGDILNKMESDIKKIRDSHNELIRQLKGLGDKK